jgi:hypothetical protein
LTGRKRKKPVNTDYLQASLELSGHLVGMARFEKPSENLAGGVFLF